MTHKSIAQDLISEKLDDIWKEYSRVQDVPHDDYEGYLEKNRILKALNEKIVNLNFDLDILKFAHGNHPFSAPKEGSFFREMAIIEKEK